MNIKKYLSATIIAMSALVVTAGFGLAPTLASAQTTPSPAWSGSLGGSGFGHGSMGGRMGMIPGVFGSVTAVNGATLTISGRQGFSHASSTPATVVYTVDASNATVKKDNATTTVASIAVGDTVAVRGTVSGTNVTATAIFDGVMPMMRGGRGGPGMGGMGTSTRTMPMSPITGNGQPVIAGSVSAISGNTLTVTNKSNVTYTVDVTNAKIVEGQSTIAVTGITVGDNVIIQGAVSGTSVTASSVIDQPVQQTSSGGISGQGQNTQMHHGGIFSSIGSFFSRIFGF